MEKKYDAEAAIEPEKGVLKEEKQAEPSKKDQAYISGLMKFLHSKKTAPIVDEMLQAGPPEQTIPEVALMVNDQMESAVTKKSGKPSLDTLLQAGVYLVSDLIEIGNAGGFFQIESEEQVKPILQSTLQTYIEKGLKDGSVDPIELQAKVEPLMDEQSRNIGLEASRQLGVPEHPDQNTQMEVYGMQKYKEGMLKGGA